jgi:hypothetical protein
MTTIEIEFVLKKEPTCLWLSQVLYAAVAQGTRFNSGKFSGTYWITPNSEPTNEIKRTVSNEIDRTELIAEAIDVYSDCNPEKTRFYLSTTYVASEPNLPVRLKLHPYENSFILSMETNVPDIEDGDHFREFLSLPQALFERFEFIYGGSITGEDFLPETQEEAYADRVRNVTFYPPEMAETIGREKLLSAPAATVTELHDNSIFLLMSESPLGAGPNTRKAIEEHLSG